MSLPSLADLDVLILEACREISAIIVPEDEWTGTLSGDGTLLRHPDMVTSDLGKWKSFISALSFKTESPLQNGEGDIPGYCRYHNGTIYINPSSDNDVATHLQLFHAVLSTNLEFEDDCANGCCVANR
jgi:hypothetical protein